MESLVLVYLLVRLSVTLCDRQDPAVIRATASIAQKNCVSLSDFLQLTPMVLILST